VDQIKIDQTFVRRVTQDTGEDAIIRAMLSVTDRLGLGVIAEGVETVEQRDFLRREGCMLGQGYLFSMPLQADTIRNLLAKRAKLPLPVSDTTHIRAYS
jgi:EAL domain-containing protein (putative c-di-GMP-specific phosphodiesterase class I)